MLILTSIAEAGGSWLSDVFVFVFAGVCVIGFYLKLVSIKALHTAMKSKQKYGNTFLFMLWFEVSDLFMALIVIFEPTFRCTFLCTTGFDYIAKMFQLIFFSYILNVIQQFQTFLEIAFAYERIKAFKPRNTQMKFRYRVIIMMAVALVISSNNLVSRSIQPFAQLNSTGQILYKISNNDWAQNQFLTIALFTFVMARTLGLYALIFVLNLVAIHKYKEFMAKKVKLLFTQQATTPEQAQANKTESTQNLNKAKKEGGISKLLMAMSTVFLIGNLPNALGLILSLLLGTGSSISNYVNVASTIIAGVSHIGYIFIFAAYNKTYRRALYRLFGDEWDDTQSS